MKEIKKVVAVCSVFSAITFLLVVGTLIIMNDILISLHDLEKDVNIVNYNVRGVDEKIGMNRNTEINIRELLNDYKKLKIENEILLREIHSYKEKYD